MLTAYHVIYAQLELGPLDLIHTVFNILCIQIVQSGPFVMVVSLPGDSVMPQAGRQSKSNRP